MVHSINIKVHLYITVTHNFCIFVFHRIIINPFLGHLGILRYFLFSKYPLNLLFVLPELAQATFHFCPDWNFIFSHFLKIWYLNIVRVNQYLHSYSRMSSVNIRIRISICIRECPKPYIRYITIRLISNPASRQSIKNGYCTVILQSENNNNFTSIIHQPYSLKLSRSRIRTIANPLWEQMV